MCWERIRDKDLNHVWNSSRTATARLALRARPASAILIVCRVLCQSCVMNIWTYAWRKCRSWFRVSKQTSAIPDKSYKLWYFQYSKKNPQFCKNWLQNRKAAVMKRQQNSSGGCFKCVCGFKHVCVWLHRFRWSRGWIGQVTQPGQVDSLHLKQAEKLNHSSSLPLFLDLLLAARCCFISRTPPARCFHAESDRNSRHFLLIKKPWQKCALSNCFLVDNYRFFFFSGGGTLMKPSNSTFLPPPCMWPFLFKSQLPSTLCSKSTS